MSMRSAVLPEAPAAGVTAPPVLDMERIALLRSLRHGALLPQLVRTYIDEAARQVAALQTAAAARDCAALASCAHNLKSASFSVGAQEMGELCETLETAGRDRALNAALGGAASLGDAFARALAKLEILL